ncbi:unnamed protein product [marine sediment metagenome]|uniref:Uncharacterized protein n=1 Tax=marine sediment metagenome TaxID=412755 RepID=X1V9P7_9ZZZZ
MTEEIERGSITWDLPESILFTPGETIPITATITNPTDEERLYFLGWALIRNGEMISFGGVEIEEIEDWIITGHESHEISFELSSEFTDCYLNLSLISGITAEEEELEVIEEIIDSLSTYLYSATVSPLAIQAQWIQAVMGVIMAVWMGAFVVQQVVKVAKGEEVERPPLISK